MKKKLVFLLYFCLQMAGGLYAQTVIDEESGSMENGGSNHFSWGRDTTGTDEDNIPVGLFMWRLDERLGNVIPAENDTLTHHFQNSNLTDGYTGQYNMLGNLGSPRLSRLYMDRKPAEQFIFLQLFDFFYTTPSNFLFANTKSPITNLTYHSCGTRENGEDRIRAYFASNISKIAGIGFKLDYLYGRGYYNNQANSQFNGTLYGYYQGDRYNMHALISSNHMKMGENGGIEDDAYITDPQSFPQSVKSRDIPTVLAQTWNRNDDQTYYLTHRYNWGFYREKELPDSLKPEIPSDRELLLSLSDSLRTVAEADSLRLRLTIDSLRKDFVDGIPVEQEFLPVTSLIHTLKIHQLRHSNYTYDIPEGYYTHYYYSSPDAVRDRSRGFSVKNTVGLSLREGFNKWAKAGLTAFAAHEFREFRLPGVIDDTMRMSNVYRENNVSVGGELNKSMGKTLHFNAYGEVVLAGTDAGQFELDGRADVNFRLLRDTVQLAAHAFVKNLNPTFFYRHYHSRFTWWDNNNLNKELRTRIEGTLSLKRTRTQLRIGVENVSNYTYFATEKTPYTLANGRNGYSHAVAVRQKDGSTQLFSAILNQDFKLGILHWDNEVAYQKSSNADALPLPDLSLYSNLYIVFRIAKVLRVELGGDVRYFTSYYVPDYAPTIGQFTVQDEQTRIKLGNYPVCNVYANLHLKHCRLYALVNHVNAGTGNAFLVPHYPINPLTIHFGLSWNFFN